MEFLVLYSSEGHLLLQHFSSDTWETAYLMARMKIPKEAKVLSIWESRHGLAVPHGKMTEVQYFL